MQDKIIELIYEWNPIEIFPLLIDEYSLESKKILHAIEKSKSIDELTQSINSIFNHSFGKEFSRSIEECRVIAEKLIKMRQ